MLEVEKREMFLKTCPFSKQFCNNGCVHFYPGFAEAFTIEDIYCDIVIRGAYEDPCCKLWNLHN
jgi:hypothetical protein